MPGEESLRKKQYYGHKQNQFWRIIFALFNVLPADDYEVRRALLTSHRIALWDVLQSCEGRGSLDSNIENEKPNDFNSFFRQYPHISHVCFTSQKAFAFYKKYIGFDFGKIYITLPSPSPANARMTFEEKVERWKILSDILSKA